MEEKLKVIISAEIEKLKSELQKGQKEVEDFGKKSKSTLKEFGEGLQKAGDVSKKAMAVVGGAVAGAAVALLALDEATKEYRRNQALLATAFETAGGSAGQAKEVYNDLYRVLGDDGQATEAAQHLAKLTTNQKDLADWTNICQGVYATFGASLPIESLTEAANETAKTGALTGALADALNWAGVSEEAFQAKLDACNTEAEREALIRETLNGLYSDAAANYETNNAALLAQNSAQAKLNENMAKIGEAMTPINTAFQTFAAVVLEELTPYIVDFATNHLPTLQVVLAQVAQAIGDVIGWLVDNWEMVSTIALIVGAIATALTTLSTVMAIVNAVMAASPITWVILGIVALIAVIALIITYWDEFKEATRAVWEPMVPFFEGIWTAIKEMVAAAWEAIKAVWDVVAPYFMTLWENIKVYFNTVKEVLSAAIIFAWEYIKVVWDNAVSYFQALWDTVKGIFAVVESVFKGDFEGAWNAVKGIFSTWKSYFTGLWNNVKTIFSAAGTFFKSAFTSAWNGIKQIFSNWGSFFSGLWNSVVNVFKGAGEVIGGAVKGAVSTAVNAVLSTAVGIINGFISAINMAISVINAIPGVSVSTLTPLSVPAMARGGVVESATLAQIGENGAEAVVPLENNLGWLDKMAAMLSDRMGGGRPIVLEVDGRTFAQISCDSINDLTRQRGSIPLVVY